MGLKSNFDTDGGGGVGVGVEMLQRKRPRNWKRATECTNSILLYLKYEFLYMNRNSSEHLEDETSIQGMNTR